MAKTPFLSTFNLASTAHRLRAVLDNLAHDPIRPDLPGFESYVYGQGYIFELPRNLRVLSVDASLTLAVGVFGDVARKRNLETNAAYDLRLGELYATRPGAVPIPLTTLEISTALRYIRSRRLLDPGNKEPINGLSVGKMLDMIDVCAKHDKSPQDVPKIKRQVAILNDLKAATRFPSFNEVLKAERARIEARKESRKNLMDSFATSDDVK